MCSNSFFLLCSSLFCTMHVIVQVRSFHDSCDLCTAVLFWDSVGTTWVTLKSHGNLQTSILIGLLIFLTCWLSTTKKSFESYHTLFWVGAHEGLGTWGFGHETRKEEGYSTVEMQAVKTCMYVYMCVWVGQMWSCDRPSCLTNTNRLCRVLCSIVGCVSGCSTLWKCLCMYVHVHVY